MLKSRLSLPNKGFLPVVIILALSLVSVLSVAVFFAFKGEDSSAPDNSVATEASTNAFQAANSGSEAVLKKIYKEDGPSDLKALAEAVSSTSECTEGVISGSTSVGSYKVSLYDGQGEQIKNCNDSTWRGQVAQLKSDGTSGDTSRGINVAVAAEPTPGITGGCTINHNTANLFPGSSGETHILSSWGVGCQEPAAQLPDGIIHCSSTFETMDGFTTRVVPNTNGGRAGTTKYAKGERPSVAIPGYSCGEMSVDGSGMNKSVYCSCVKK